MTNALLPPPDLTEDDHVGVGHHAGRVELEGVEDKRATEEVVTDDHAASAQTSLGNEGIGRSEVARRHLMGRHPRHAFSHGGGTVARGGHRYLDLSYLDLTRNQPAQTFSKTFAGLLMSPELVLVIRANSIGMDDEPDPATTNPEQALFWRNIYTEILTMEEAVLDRIRQLMATQSPEARHEVELTNVPVVVAQVERFRARWESGTPLSECMRRKAALLARESP